MICHRGTIKTIENNMLYVEIERSSACAACHAKSVCPSFDKKNEMIVVPVKDVTAFQIGESVQVNLKKTMGGKAVVLAYLFPFLALIAGLFTTYYFTKNELLSVGVAFAATTLYFLFIKKIDNKLKKHFVFSVHKIL